MSELDTLMTAFAESGGDKAILSNEGIAHLVASGHSIVSSRMVEGLEVRTRETRTGVSAVITVKAGVRIASPIHLCFGVLHKRGTQKITMDVRLERNASARFIAHCIFPKAEKVRHIMDAKIDISRRNRIPPPENELRGDLGFFDTGALGFDASRLLVVKTANPNSMP